MDNYFSKGVIFACLLMLLVLDLNRDGLTRTICAVAILVGVWVADYLAHKIKCQCELIDIELEMSEVMDNVDDLQNAIYELQTTPKCDWPKILKGMIRDFKIAKEARKRARKTYYENTLGIFIARRFWKYDDFLF
ncbi:hypothetical protein AVEN_247064-1 [Araneus ventricosus]|uniref:Uncharacterized protein n=1 Tax=Araneus ventricosus TaxID=182803 RepID=A0A4Y2RRX6_ARAVE|nr:hypothetical protein AVEN_215014-1 [Araneus ventricosus]GBN78592.1 hypothetical protein AVEN_247064-1 [Araneus ventricosus]